MNKKTLTIVSILVLIAAGYFLYLQANPKEEMPMQEDTTQVAEPMMQEPVEEEPMNIVEVAVDAGNFTTLVTAVQEAELVETLSGPGPFTVFAPTDEAFAKIPEETLSAILADKDQLASILTYHVISGKVMAADVVELTSATTVQGQDVVIEVMEDGTVKINDATVVVTDIEASNGVIHVIDTVLLPQEE